LGIKIRVSRAEDFLNNGSSETISRHLKEYSKETQMLVVISSKHILQEIPSKLIKLYPSTEKRFEKYATTGRTLTKKLLFLLPLVMTMKKFTELIKRNLLSKIKGYFLFYNLQIKTRRATN